MRHVILVILLALSILAPLSFTTINVTKAQNPTITVAVDLAHGERDKYLDYIMGNITFVNWTVIKQEITPDILANVDVLILGQPTVNFSPTEIAAIQNWLAQGNKVLWVAGDSDYGAGPDSQKACNFLLSQIGARLRIEYASAYDQYFNARRFYRVLGFVAPDDIPLLNTSIIVDGVKKPVLYHGTAPVIWVDENGTPHDPVNETFPGLIRIVWTSPIAYIGINNPPPPMLYDTTYRDRTFILLAAEYHNDTGNLIVVSGESPYGDYEPTWSWMYYGIPLDGPRFVTNMIKWFVWIIENKPVAPDAASITPPPMPANTTYPFTYVSYVPFQDGVNIYGLDLDHGGIIADITYMAENIILGKERPGVDVPGLKAAIFELVTNGTTPWYGLIPLYRAQVLAVIHNPTNITVVTKIGPFTDVYPGLVVYRVLIVFLNNPTFLIGYFFENTGNETLNITVAPSWYRESGFMVEINTDILNSTNDFYYAIFDDGSKYIELKNLVPWGTEIFKHVRGIAVVDNQDTKKGFVIGLSVHPDNVSATYRLWVESAVIRVEFGNITLAPGGNATYILYGYAGPLDYDTIAATGSPELMDIYNIFTTLVRTTTVTTTTTTTETTTETTTATVTTTATTTVNVTTTETVTKTTTTTHTVTTTSPTTTTVTQTITNWTMTGIIAVILFIIGLIIGYVVKRK